MDTKEKVGNTTANRRRKPSARPAPGPRDPKREKTGESKPLQEIVYVPPKPFIRNRLLLRLATVAAIVLALVLAMAVFFRVEHIQVSGMEQYTAWDISQASGIEKGDSLFSLELTGAAARIKALDYVSKVRISIRLPNTVIIEVTEVQVTYAIQDQSKAWWIMDSNGTIIDKAQEDTLDKHTKIQGVQLLDPEKGKQASAFETAEPGVDENGNTIPVTVTAAHRLSVALSIAQLLEANGIIGQAADMDVSDLGNLQFWYGQQYQVKLGDENQLSRKISLIKGAINQFSTGSYNSGVLEAIPDGGNDGKGEVKYIPFQ